MGPRHSSGPPGSAAAEAFGGADQPKYRDLGIDRVATADGPRQVTVSKLRETPFLVLRLFAREGGAGLPVLLLVPPLSGHFPILMRDMVVGLLPDFRVAVLDWANVRHVSARRGPFGFDDNVIAVADAIEALPGASVVALCQGGVPALAAVADLAARDPERVPPNLVLMAAPMDPLANPTPVVKLIRRMSAFWYQTVPIARVGPGFAGRGRWVYPAASQLSGLRQFLSRHGAIHGDELARKITADDGADPERFPFEDLYSSVMDIDARHFAENINRVFLRREAATGRLHLAERPVDPGAIRGMSLLTVEGALDDIAAPGQTSAALGLCTGLPADRRQALVVPDCGHFGLFHGRIWRRQVLPVLRAHCLRG